MSNSKNFSLNKNLCLRCGHEWRSNRMKTTVRTLDNQKTVVMMPSLFPPARCARCRSPLWNTPRRNKRAAEAEASAVEELKYDRDAYERLYKSQKLRTEELFAEVNQLKRQLKHAQAIIDEQFDDLAALQLASRKQVE